MWRQGIRLAALLLPLAALGAEPPLTVRFSNQEYAPYMAENLPFGGILTRVVTEVFRRGNVSVRYGWYPNNRAIQMARTGDVDGSLGWTPNAERQKDLLFSEEVLPFRMVLFQRLGETYTWKTLEDLAPYRFGITAGNFYSDTFTRLQHNGVLKVDVTTDDISNLRKLAAGRIDLFPMEGEAGQLTTRLQLPPAMAARIVPQAREYWSTPLCVVIWRGHPQAGELVRRFNRELKKMKDSGELALLITQTRHAIFAHIDKKR
ncbi:substrate-binding periplasmic protein [Vogesella mureinivorans]|uniref:substrate-binding periplasmic protein n=1 Tax=Vogesella mureinivorans TaxID=657276 RepID=UPI001980E0BB|nr:transporter substrate-binding domain-containing protein [Vogesella mureinivorans]